MKKLLLLGIILTVCVVIVAFVFAQFYPEGMISYWKFDESEGITASDSADANDGTLINGPVWTAGKVGGALSFDGLDDYVEVPNSANLDITDAITIEAWVYMISAPTNMRVICKPYSISAWTSPYADYELVILNEATGWSGYPGRAVYFGLNLGGAWIYLGTTSLNTVPLDAWTHLAATYDGSSMKICINGIERAFRSVSGTIGTSDNPLFIGTRTPAPGEVFSGLIDEVAIYGRALSEAEIQQHYENGSYEVECVPPPSGMVSWWPGDTDANDIQDGNNGTLINDALAGVTGKVDGAFSFDGVDDYVDVGNIGVTGDWTIDFWTKLDTVAPRIQYPIGISTRLSPHYGSGVFMAFTDDSNAWGLYDGNQNWQKPYLHLVLGSPVSADVWYHIAVIKSGTTYTLYLNGNYENSESILDDIDITNLQVGRRLDPGGGFGHFDGLIDEVEIFNRALTSSEIQAIYLAGSAGKCKITNQPPVAVCKDITIECQATITPEDVDGGSHDPDEGDPITRSIDNEGPFSLGNHSVCLTVTDDSGESDTCHALVTVIDTTPPEILSVSVSPNILRPPNHKMILITPDIVVSDNCDSDPTVVVISITTNEGDETDTFHPDYDLVLGDGHTTSDIQMDVNGNIYLRAERSGKGTGRIYTITYKVIDASGNSSATAEATVTVPHDQR